MFTKSFSQLEAIGYDNLGYTELIQQKTIALEMQSKDLQVSFGKGASLIFASLSSLEKKAIFLDLLLASPEITITIFVDDLTIWQLKVLKQTLDQLLKKEVWFPKRTYKYKYLMMLLEQKEASFAFHLP